MITPVRTLVVRCPATESHAFEPVVAALYDITPELEVSRPGTCAFAARGPSRYFGGDGALARKVLETVAQVLGRRSGVRIGIADGLFTAAVATELADPICIVESGGSSAFLAPLPVRMLGSPELCDVLVRLGIVTLGAFADLPAADVLARFGVEGRRAQCLAAGIDERPLAPMALPADWSVSTEIDPPADRLDRVAFCARALAEQLHRRLEDAGMSCVRVAVEVETADGGKREHLWHHEGGLTAADIADRVRRLLAGASRSSGGIVRLTLIGHEVVPARGRRLGFWGGEAEADERAVRVVARLSGRFGVDAVRVPDRRGGRHPDEQFALVSAASVDLHDRRLAADDRPWPGRLPVPSPSRLLPVPWAAELQDPTGAPVRVTGREMISAPPARLMIGGRLAGAIVAWAGPWISSERWWDHARHRRRARLQVLIDCGLACLVTLERGRWQVSAVWD